MAIFRHGKPSSNALRQTLLRVLLLLCLSLCCLSSNLNAQTTDKAFAHYPIPDSIFAKMDGRSYKKGCTVRREDLRYVRVLHVTAEGETRQGEMVCHKDIADTVVAIFRELFEARYPIERMTLIDEYDADDTQSMEANNTSCFNFRALVGGGKLSRHATGHAIDINPLYNPYVKTGRNGATICQPASGQPYTDRSKTFKYKIVEGDACHKAFTKRGFRWGGAWRTMKDWQHFDI